MADSGIQEEQPSSPFKVVIAIDASKQAEYAVNWEVFISPGQVAELWEEAKNKSGVLEEKYRHIMRTRGIDGVKMRKEGGLKPGSVVVKTATEEKANMLVMGTRGIGVVRRTILGSVSDYVVHHAHCPVVICRHGEK